jgi:hypothetical protein
VRFAHLLRASRRPRAALPTMLGSKLRESVMELQASSILRGPRPRCFLDDGPAAGRAAPGGACSLRGEEGRFSEAGVCVTRHRVDACASEPHLYANGSRWRLDSGLAGYSSRTVR